MYLPGFAGPTKVPLDFMELVRDFTGNVTTSSTESVPPNKNRTGLLLINDSDTVIYVNLGIPAVVNAGIRLNAAGGSYEIIKTNPFKGAINAIHGGAGNKVLCAVEIEDRYASQ